MAEYKSKHGIVSRPPYELYMSFADMRNFLRFLPEDKREGVTADYDTLKASVQGFRTDPLLPDYPLGRRRALPFHRRIPFRCGERRL